MRRKGLFILALGIILLILVPVILFLPSRSTTTTSAPESVDDSPEGVALNYQMALIEKDYARAMKAFSSSLAGRPQSPEDLYNDLKDQGQLPEWELSPCIYIEDVETEEKQATVTLREQFYDPCTGIEVQNLSFGFIHMELDLEDGVWRVIDSSEYFAPCWTGVTSCD